MKWREESKSVSAGGKFWRFIVSSWAAFMFAALLIGLLGDIAGIDMESSDGDDPVWFIITAVALVWTTWPIGTVLLYRFWVRRTIKVREQREHYKQFQQP